MVAPAPNPPARPNTAEIRTTTAELRRWLEGRVDKDDERQRKVETDVAELKGRLAQLLAQVPTIWTLAALTVAKFGLGFVLLRFGLPH